MAITPTTTIRVTVQTRDRLTTLALERGVSTTELIADLVQRAEDDALLDRANREWAANPEQVRRENEIWDGTAGDGLEGLG